MAVEIEMPVGFVGFAYKGDEAGYAFDTRESAVKYMNPETIWGNHYLRQDPDSGYWVWWMDYI